MAVGLITDFKIYQEEFWGGYTESLAQNTDVFNGASNGAIVLEAEISKGQYSKESFLKIISSLVARRDPSATDAVTPLKGSAGEYVRVKLDRRIGPVDTSLTALAKIASSESELSFLLGQQIGGAVAGGYVNSAVMSVNAALSGITGLNYDYSATGTTKHVAMASTLAKMGDRSSKVVAWVGHSKAYFDLVGNAIADKITNVADVTIYGGSPGTFNRPFIVTDDSSLITTGTPDKYHTLGLVAGAVSIVESEGKNVVSEIVTGYENLIFRMQGEYAFTVGVKGFAWDITNGGSNPNDTALGTATNWDQAATSTKDLAGVRLTAQ